MATIIEMRDIVKRYPGVLANDHVYLEVEEGEIHGLLGENGAGKTTLMNLLSGLSSPDSGTIILREEKVSFSSCKDAIDCGIGMVHQHFMLVPVFTVAENIVLGDEPVNGVSLDKSQAVRRVKDLSAQYGLKVDPKALIRDIPVGMQQRVEIIKALSRGAEILILDEPTAVLTPQEVEELYVVMRALKEQGVTIIFITHKLREVKEIVDRVTVLRDGRTIETVDADRVEEGDLARMMVGREVILHVDKPPTEPGEVILEVEHLSARDARDLPALKDISFSARAGEIVGIAGVAGNGQSELAEVLTGLRETESGSIYLDGKEIRQLDTRQRIYEGLTWIPEDRQRRGLVMDFTVLENFLLAYEDAPPFAKGLVLDYDEAEDFASRAMKKFNVMASGPGAQAKTLSGGNQQKLIVAREFERNPRVLVASQPTRGLDVAATEFVHNQLIDLRDEGKAVLLISMELSEILDLSDRILVMYEGEIVGSFGAQETTAEELGMLMAGSRVDRLNERVYEPYLGGAAP